MFVYINKNNIIKYIKFTMLDEKLIFQLAKIGLSKKAAKIYTALLLNSGGLYPSKLAEITKINRSTVYKVLLDLSIKELATEIIKGKKTLLSDRKP